MKDAHSSKELMVGQFSEEGKFKSEKCVGSGSCISACPYSNIHFYDIRNVIRDKLSAKGSGAK